MWMYRGKEIYRHEDLLPECTDFVYMLRFGNQQCYIGKKTVRSVRRLKPTKKQLAIRKNYVRKEMVNLPFLKYEGSHNKEGLKVLEKEIIYQCSTKKAATYLETALLFHYNAIFDDEYTNENISGRFFDNDLDGLLDPDIDDEAEFVSISGYDKEVITVGEIGAIR